MIEHLDPTVTVITTQTGDEYAKLAAAALKAQLIFVCLSEAVQFAKMQAPSVYSKSVADMFGGPTITATNFNMIAVDELLEHTEDDRIPGLLAQWNRAKVQRNKNLMRDLEKRIKCIRGY